MDTSLQGFTIDTPYSFTVLQPHIAIQESGAHFFCPPAHISCNNIPRRTGTSSHIDVVTSILQGHSSIKGHGYITEYYSLSSLVNRLERKSMRYIDHIQTE
ncbi:hypothetical protein BofuT4_P037450.1 [Botrytis cinerea T4]|uniref:Uncharacterized protein n=1 Tax=Botryotinia fuckeliana (strain T4) TaxID=999810 RepID=G2Y525_BOTF4|nr:hypothetical protein BofuT4_P037450.1 [Botrytis cinerea T4]